MNVIEMAKFQGAGWRMATEEESLWTRPSQEAVAAAGQTGSRRPAETLQGSQTGGHPAQECPEEAVQEHHQAGLGAGRGGDVGGPGAPPQQLPAHAGRGRGEVRPD